MTTGDYPNSITISSSSMSCSTGYTDCNTYTDSTTWRYFDSYEAWKQHEQPSPRKYTLEEIQKQLSEYPKESPKKIEGVDIMTLYDVYLVYAEDRKKPVIIPMFGVIANGEEDAQIKSGLMKKVEDDWDADYLTFIVKAIGSVKVKEKAKEVRTVK
jgi:hypothetical protein